MPMHPHGQNDSGQQTVQVHVMLYGEWRRHVVLYGELGRNHRLPPS